MGSGHTILVLNACLIELVDNVGHVAQGFLCPGRDRDQRHLGIVTRPSAGKGFNVSKSG